MCRMDRTCTKRKYVNDTMNKKYGCDFMFYERFYQLCEKAGVTPSYVADEIGINKSTVYMWKNQGTAPRYDTAKKIAEYFKISVDNLLEEKEMIKEPRYKKTLKDQLEENLINKIIAVLEKGNRVELIPTKDGIKIVRIQRKSI